MDEQSKKLEVFNRIRKMWKRIKQSWKIIWIKKKEKIEEINSRLNGTEDTHMEAKQCALNNQWVTEEINKEIFKYLETNDMKTKWSKSSGLHQNQF